MIDTIIVLKKTNIEESVFRLKYQTWLSKQDLYDPYTHVVRVAIGSLDSKEPSKEYRRLQRLCKDNFNFFDYVRFYSGDTCLEMRDCALIPTVYPFGLFFEFESVVKHCWQMNIKEAPPVQI